MPNKLGSGVTFGTSALSQSLMNGKIVSFTFKNAAQIKTAVDGNGYFVGVDVAERMQVAEMTVLTTISGSATTLPNILDAVTVTDPSSNASGSWNVSGTPTLNWKKEDYQEFTCEVSRWITSTGAFLA